MLLRSAPYFPVPDVAAAVTHYERVFGFRGEYAAGDPPQFAIVSRVVCAYDMEKFDGAVIVDAFRAHPAVIIGGSLHENPFYISTDRMIEEMRSRNAH